jgi:hypothetical protein
MKAATASRSRPNVADLVVGNRKIALPLGVGLVRRRKTLRNLKAGAIGFEGLGKIAPAI